MRKSSLLFALLLFLGSLTVGCAAGLTDSKEARTRRIHHINEIQSRQLIDDWDYFMLYDRSSYLSEYHARVGG
jgi:hypothetical protein